MSAEVVDPWLYTIRARAVRVKGLASEVLHDIDTGRLGDAATRTWNIEEAAHSLIGLLMEQVEHRRADGPGG